MKKTIWTALAVFGLAVTANAGILYWQVDNDTLEGTAYSNYSYAKISYGATTAALGQSYLNSAIVGGDGTTYDSLLKTDFAAGVIGYASFGDSTGGYFAVELFTDSGTALAHSVLSYDSVTQYIRASDQFSINWSTTNAGAFASGVSWSAGAVPEPTSGVLLLVGAALLGLRRKRA